MNGLKYQSFHVGNMMRHLKSKHPPLHQEMVWKYDRMTKCKKVKERSIPKTTLTIKMDANELRLAMLETVTEDALPFTAVENKGFSRLAKPIQEALAASKESFPITAETARALIPEKAEAIRQELREELKGHRCSLKIDGVSRLNRCFLGINVQFVRDAKLCIRTLAVTEILTTHTAEAIRDIILETLEVYDVDVKHVYTANSDSGSNMTKAVQLVKELQRENLISDAEAEADLILDFEDESYLLSLEEIIELYADDGFTLLAIPCAAHVLQLAVADFLKNPGLRIYLDAFREEVRTLRTQNKLIELRRLNAPIPPAENSTRWHSTLCMLEGLLRLKPLAVELRINLSEDEWRVLKELCDVLLPVRITTKMFEEENCLVGDFWINWLKLKLKLQRQSSPYAKDMLQALEDREAAPSRNGGRGKYPLFGNPAVVTAGYLDPRIFPVLTPAQVEMAEETLRKLHRSFRNDGTEIQESPRSESENEEEELDPFEQFMREKNAARVGTQDQAVNAGVTGMDDKLEVELSRYKKEVPLMPQKTDVLAWWKSREGFQWPLLSKLSDTVLSAPATQVSVERLFSAVKFVLCIRRYKLKSDILQDILLIRSNTNFMDKFNAYLGFETNSQSPPSARHVSESETDSSTSS